MLQRWINKLQCTFRKKVVVGGTRLTNFNSNSGSKISEKLFCSRTIFQLPPIAKSEFHPRFPSPPKAPSETWTFDDADPALHCLAVDENGIKRLHDDSSKCSTECERVHFDALPLASSGSTSTVTTSRRVLTNNQGAFTLHQCNGNIKSRYKCHISPPYFQTCSNCEATKELCQKMVSPYGKAIWKRSYNGKRSTCDYENGDFTVDVRASTPQKCVFNCN